MSRRAMVDTNAEAFRRAWQIFFSKAGVDGQILEIAVGGGQHEAFALFSSQFDRYMKDNATEPKPLLLVDSEEPVADGHTVWQHLGTRNQHRFQQPPQADDDSAYMMVQAMETWFLADQETLKRYFGALLDTDVLHGLAPLEAVAKEDALTTLRQATHRCSRHYRKGKRASDILGELDPQTVAAACHHADELLQYLRTL